MSHAVASTPGSLIARSSGARARSDEGLGAQITASFVGSDRTYDARRDWHDVLDRQFEATAPNQKWIADFTYIWTAEGWLYLAGVIDLFSRRVVGWSMSATMAAQLVVDALMMAIGRRGKPDALLHHSDQDGQHTSEPFRTLLADHGVSCSLSWSGNVWDNAAMKGFSFSLKPERTARKVYRTRDQDRADVFDYIERFYNPRRRHSTIGYLSPVEFERNAASA